MVPVHERPSVFYRRTEKDGRPKTWAENDLHKFIDSTIVGKAIAHTLRDLAKKSLLNKMGRLLPNE